jgi:hypothetical protein
LDPGGMGWRIQGFTPKLGFMEKINKDLKIKTRIIEKEWQKTITSKKIILS